jgi:general secretion pathway protein D
MPPGISGILRGPVLPGSETIVPGGIPAFGVLLQAVQGSNDVNIISTPQLLTMDNEEAEIQVSEKRPFSSGLSLGGLSGLGSLAGGASSALSSLGSLGLGSVNITREDVGLTLKLKPQINDQQYVRLEIDQELSDVIGTDANTQQPITSKRAAKTVVVVRDQDSVVIGGLVRDRETESEGKTPLLGDIPLIGWLFKRQTTQFEKVNLLLVLTPYIIRGPEDFYKIYQRKMKERREFVERYYGDSEDFRANVDWERKPGPLALYRQELRDELLKAENGGPGTDGETVVTPESSGDGPVDLPPDGDTPTAPSGEATPPVEPPPVMDEGIEQ